jgi:hypothetical protein
MAKADVCACVEWEWIDVFARNGACEWRQGGKKYLLFRLYGSVLQYCSNMRSAALLNVNEKTCSAHVNADEADNGYG